MDFRKIEKKWQKKWEDAKLFESNPDKRKKFFITFPYPYVNGAPHIGHSYSSLRTDAYARFKRMQGFNVLYPQGYHATGEPIVGVQKRLKKNDKAQIDTLKRSGVTDKDIKNFKKSPEFIVKFWIKKWEKVLRETGFSIDWRRSFVTTQLTPTYSRFIEWQYNTLKKKGFVVQGTHPVIWCPTDQSPTGDHDRLEGEGESIVDYVILKFQYGDYILTPATLRPETIYGVTNIWVNPDVDYVKATVDGEKWILSREAVDKLKDQLKDIKIEGEINGKEMLGGICKNPITNKEIPILPARFVKPDNATGIVMSVPAHAPYDWVALKELMDKDELEQYGVTKNDIEPISIVEVKEFKDAPAVEVVNNLKINSLDQIKELEKATKIVYKKEFHQGKLKEECGEYAGLNISEAKDKLIIDFIEKDVASVIWETTGKVVCRCTTPNHVKILENQWFLKFSDEEWKNKLRTYLKKMKIYPNEARQNFENTIDWMKDKACTRKSGLGTPLPWDTSSIVETLSDSTIYMAYYTIVRIINENKIKEKVLTDEVFDYIFLEKGIGKTISKNSGLNFKLLEEMKKEFEYYYPMDFRNSGKDLIQNHLTFCLFHHTAIWPEKNWPKGFGVNGFVAVEGEKMSKSKGNIIPMVDLLDQFGADMTRINVITSSEGIDDADWRSENIKGFRLRFDMLFDIAKNISKAKSSKKKNIDIYMNSVINRIIKNSTKHFESTNFRTAGQYVIFESTNALKWYLKRIGGIENANKAIMKNVMSTLVRLLAPFTPHICEELWYILGNKSFVSIAKWPESNETEIIENSEVSEKMIQQVMNDIEEIKKIVKIKPKKITIIVAEDWKFQVQNIVMNNKGKPMNDIIKIVMSGDSKKYGKASLKFIVSIYKKMNELNIPVPRKTQLEVFGESLNFFKNETKCIVEVIDGSKSKNDKVKSSTPSKPGILLE